jgi:hypothetical protein
VKRPKGFCNFGGATELLLDSGDCIADRRNGLGREIVSVASSWVLVGLVEVVGRALRQKHQLSRGSVSCRPGLGVRAIPTPTRGPLLARGSVNNQSVDSGASVGCQVAHRGNGHSETRDRSDHVQLIDVDVLWVVEEAATVSVC